MAYFLKIRICDYSDLTKMRIAIPFFEASSVSNSSYAIDFRNLKNSQSTLTKIPYILPPEPNGCRIDRAGDSVDNKPSFWILI